MSVLRDFLRQFRAALQHSVRKHAFCAYIAAMLRLRNNSLPVLLLLDELVDAFVWPVCREFIVDRTDSQSGNCEDSGGSGGGSGREIEIET